LIEFRSARPSAQHVLCDHVVGQRLLLLLDVLADAAQVIATESLNTILEHPLIGERGDPRVQRKTLVYRLGDIYVIDLIKGRDLERLNRDRPRDGRRLFGDYFVQFNSRFDRCGLERCLGCGDRLFDCRCGRV
jgi:hypothetical protein